MLLEALDGDETVVYRAAAASAQVQVEPVGRWFEAYIRRRNRNVSSSFQELEEEEESSEESADEEFQLEEYSMLRKLDPKDWKNQDHYAVLGLPHLRYKATQKQIKAAREYVPTYTRVSRLWFVLMTQSLPFVRRQIDCAEAPP
uniref:Uncharacterized protein n=1 Tax=Neolamprologus brichardi TaxID=32507 RepID=A0A3Q4H5U8_NEOBR